MPRTTKASASTEQAPEPSKPVRRARQPGTFGRLRTLPSGRVQARYLGPDGFEYTGPSTFSNEKDARRWLDRERAVIELAVKAGQPWTPPERAVAKAEAKAAAEAAKDASPLFADYSEGWLADRRVKGEPLRPSTLKDYRTSLRLHIGPTFGNTRLKAITPEAVEAWHRGLRVAGVGERPRTKAYVLLKAILASAKDSRIVGENPVSIRGAGVARAAKRVEPATVGELALITGAMPERYRLMVELMAWCALRYGEVAELRRGDVDVKAGTVKVSRTVVWLPGAPLVGPPKTAAGIRVVSVPPHIMQSVREHLARHVGRFPGGMLFPAPRTGGQLDPSVFRKYFDKAKAAAGRPDLTPHALRHTGATMAATAGATVAELQARLGHASVAAAMTYQHAVRARDAQIAAAMSTLAQGVTAGQS